MKERFTRIVNANRLAERLHALGCKSSIVSSDTTQTVGLMIEKGIGNGQSATTAAVITRAEMQDNDDGKIAELLEHQCNGCLDSISETAARNK